VNVRIEKIAIYGTEKAIDMAQQTLRARLPAELFSERESDARLVIQSLIDENDIKAAILWDGNRVWSKKKVLKDVRAVIRRGMSALSDYLYEFFHLCCGSIAHYDKQGWICEYPDVEALRNFFRNNEFGTSVLAHQPCWASDRKVIIMGINQLLKIKENT
jgi:hypothetical protein